MSGKPPEQIPGEQEPDDLEEAVRNAVLYRDLETATSTFAMGSALSLILGSIKSGEELDRAELSRLVELMDAPPPNRAEWQADGSTKHYENNIMIRHEPADPEYLALRAKREAQIKIRTDYVDGKVTSYIGSLMTQLDEGVEEAVVSILVGREDRHQGYKINGLEDEVFYKVMWHFKRLGGHKFRQEHTRILPDEPRAPGDKKIWSTLHSMHVQRDESIKAPPTYRDWDDEPLADHEDL